MSADADVRRSVDVDETVEQLAQRVEAAGERLATRQHKTRQQQSRQQQVNTRRQQKVDRKTCQ